MRLSFTWATILRVAAKSHTPTLIATEEIAGCTEKPDHGVELMHALIVPWIEHRGKLWVVQQKEIWTVARENIWVIL